MSLINKIKKHQKIIKLSMGVGFLLILTTIKGFVLSECGFGKEFWGLEILTMVLTVGFLIFLWKSIHNDVYITVGRENDEK